MNASAERDQVDCILRVATWRQGFSKAGLALLLQLLTSHNLQGIRFCVIVIVLVLQPTEKQFKRANSTEQGGWRNNC
jgi:hypothetical protein